MAALKTPVASEGGESRASVVDTQRGPLLRGGGVRGGSGTNTVTTYKTNMSNIVFLYHPQPALRRALGFAAFVAIAEKEWGFAPLCGAAATPVAALKAPVAPVAYNGQWVAAREIFQKSISKSLKNY